MGHGPQLPQALTAAAAAAATGGVGKLPALPGDGGPLLAGLLPEALTLPAARQADPGQPPLERSCDGDAASPATSWERERDVLCETAVTLPTLRALKVR
mgnify:CR=1 FL=1